MGRRLTKSREPGAQPRAGAGRAPSTCWEGRGKQGREAGGREGKERGEGEGCREEGGLGPRVSRVGPGQLCTETQDPWDLALARRAHTEPALRCGPVFRPWPSPPRGNPRPSLGQGLADVCERARLPSPIRILQTMGRPRPGIPAGLRGGGSGGPGSGSWPVSALSAGRGAAAAPGHPRHWPPSQPSPRPLFFLAGVLSKAGLSPEALSGGGSVLATHLSCLVPDAWGEDTQW